MTRETPISRAEVRQRWRAYVVLHDREPPDPENLLPDLLLPAHRVVCLVNRLVELISTRGIQARVTVSDFLQAVHLALAFFDDKERTALWLRLLRETIDLPGFGLLLMSRESPLQPPPSIHAKTVGRLVRVMPCSAIGTIGELE